MQKIVVVTTEQMMQDSLFRAMKTASKEKVATMQASIATVCAEREAYEALRERRLGDGSIVVGQSNDIRHVQALATSEPFARFCVALKVDPRAYIFPQSKEGGKTSSETSNLKAYKKARELAEVIYGTSSTLENVAKVFAVCAWKAVQTSTCKDNILPRNYAECFLNSPEFRSIREGAQELFDAIEDIRAKQMTGGGAKTQASQMIRTLVAFNAATDIRNGKSKDVRIDPNNRVITSLMRRLGQITEPQAQAEEVSA